MRHSWKGRNVDNQGLTIGIVNAICIGVMEYKMIIKVDNENKVTTLCSWCLKSGGNNVDYSVDDQHIISHGICERHKRELLDGIRGNQLCFR